MVLLDSVHNNWYYVGERGSSLNKKDSCSWKSKSITYNNAKKQGFDYIYSLEKSKIVAVGDSLLNGINKSVKNHNVKVKDIPWVTSETEIDIIDALVAQKADCLVVHGGTDGITKE